MELAVSDRTIIILTKIEPNNSQLALLAIQSTLQSISHNTVSQVKMNI